MDDHLAEFGKYRIISELGRGGMGVVYLAEDGLLNRKVALKVLYEHLNRESAFVSRFQEEARSVSSLHHRNIVCVHGMERARDAFAIDMEYVDGLSLDRFAATTRISPPLAARLGSDILEGLVTCHDIGIVHRDIKPSNILVGQDSVAKITDFGLATAYALHVKTTITGGSSSGFFMGTPRYASPAAWDGQDPIPAWDLYSLGVILFELLSGKTAFAGESPMAIMKQHLTTALPPVGQVAPTVSQELACVVDELLGSRGETNSLTSLDVLKALQETPEFDTAKCSDSTSTVTIAVRRHKIRRRVMAWQPRALRVIKVSSIVVLVVAAVLLAKVWVDRKGPDTVARGEQQRMDAPEVFLKPQSIDGSSQDGVWMLSNNDQGKATRIVTLNALGLSKLTLAPTAQENRYSVSGDWAEYLRPNNGMIVSGAISGFALVSTVEGYLSLSIERHNVRDNTTERLSLDAKPLAVEFDGPLFMQSLESNKAIQSLLYNELLPRGVTWVNEIEEAMPGYDDGRVLVPKSGAEIVIDGVLNESAWSNPPFDGQGPLGEIGQRGDGTARLLVRWTVGGVVLGVESEKVPADASLDIGLLPGLEVSLDTSRRFFATLNGNELVKSRSTAGARALPWSCDWRGQATRQGGRYQAEIFIPTDQLSELATPTNGRRWRVNVVLKDSASEVPIAYWGFEELSKPEHGVLIEFSEGTS